MAYPFENDVKTYGTQTAHPLPCPALQFENDVKTYATQAKGGEKLEYLLFKNDVVYIQGESIHLWIV